MTSHLSNMSVQSRPGPARKPAKRRVRTRSDKSQAARRLPIGAEVLRRGGVHFRVWAPKSKAVAVRLGQENATGNGAANRFPLKAEGNGYFSGEIAEAKPPMTYRFVLESGAFPDPASRFQPEGPHGPSQIVDLSKFRWTDD